MFPLKFREIKYLSIHFFIKFDNIFLSKFTRRNSGVKRFVAILHNGYFWSVSISVVPSFLDYSLISWLDHLFDYSRAYYWIGYLTRRSLYSWTVRDLIRDRVTTWEGFLVFRKRVKLSVKDIDKKLFVFCENHGNICILAYLQFPLLGDWYPWSIDKNRFIAVNF